MTREALSPERRLFDALRARGLTFGCAESCTGGLIAKRMTDLPGVSAVFKGGLVTYWNEAKADLLGVPWETLDRYGAVSEPVARAMAEGARAALRCDLAVATTGVAGPDPDDRGNPVGLVYVALASPEGAQVSALRLEGDRAAIRAQAADAAFRLLEQYLIGASPAT